jgi:hypothetical protein
MPSFTSREAQLSITFSFVAGAFGGLPEILAELKPKVMLFTWTGIR